MDYEIIPVTVFLELDEKTLTFAKLNTVMQLLNKLGIDRTDALIIRGDELLTTDRKIKPGDTITVRYVISRG